MLAQEYNRMRAVEDDYWWYRIIRNMACREVAKVTQGLSGACILDAGCGTGGTLSHLRQLKGAPELSGFDISPIALDHTRSRGFAGVYQASVDNIPLVDCSQDVILSLDVLYHQGLNQERAMQEFSRVLRPGGRLVMNLPAFECLRGQHDVAVSNARRYTPRDVRELHERNGFAVERLFCWNAWLFLPLLVWRKINRATTLAAEAKSDLVPPPVTVNNVLAAIGQMEAALCRAFRCPVGTSVFSVGRKPAE
jgi:SAM-dependent methyltransferase